MSVVRTFTLVTRPNRRSNAPAASVRARLSAEPLTRITDELGKCRFGLIGSYQSGSTMQVDREPPYRGGIAQQGAGRSTWSEHNPNKSAPHGQNRDLVSEH